MNHAKQKHIDVAFHFVREQQTEFETLVVQTIAGTENPADLGTKPLPQPAFERFLSHMINLGDRSLRTTLPTSAKAANQCENISPAAIPSVKPKESDDQVLAQAQSLLQELTQLTAAPRSNSVVRPRNKKHFNFEHRPTAVLSPDERGC